VSALPLLTEVRNPGSDRRGVPPSPRSAQPDTSAAGSSRDRELYRSRGTCRSSRDRRFPCRRTGRRAHVTIHVTKPPVAAAGVSIRGTAQSTEAAAPREDPDAAGGSVSRPTLVAAGRRGRSVRAMTRRASPEARACRRRPSRTGNGRSDSTSRSGAPDPPCPAGSSRGNEFTDRSVVLRSVAMKERRSCQPGEDPRDPAEAEPTGSPRGARSATPTPPAGHPGDQVLPDPTSSRRNNLVLGIHGRYDTENGPEEWLARRYQPWGSGRLCPLLGAVLAQARARAGDAQRTRALFQRPWTTILSNFYEKREPESSLSGRRQRLAARAEDGGTGHALPCATRWDLGGVSTSAVSPQTFQEAEPKLDLGRLRLASVGYAVVRDTRNDPFAATHGNYTSSDLRVFGPAVGSEKRFSKLFLQGSSLRSSPARSDLRDLSPSRPGVADGSSEPLPLQSGTSPAVTPPCAGFGQDLLGSCEAGTLVPIRSASHRSAGGPPPQGEVASRPLRRRRTTD